MLSSNVVCRFWAQSLQQYWSIYLTGWGTQIFFYIWVKPLILEVFNKSNKIFKILLISPIKTWGKSVQEFMGYDRKLGNKFMCNECNRNKIKFLSRCNLGETWVGKNVILSKRELGETWIEWNVILHNIGETFGWNMIGWNVIGQTVTTPFTIFCSKIKQLKMIIKVFILLSNYYNICF